VMECLAPLSLLMRSALSPFADTVFYEGSELKMAGTQGKRDATDSNLLASSHELKYIVGLLPSFSGQPLLLQTMADYLLTISLPATGALDEVSHGPVIPLAIQGRKADGTPHANCRAWFREVIEVACRVHVLVSFGKAGLITTDERLVRSGMDLAERFNISSDLESFEVHGDFAVCCYFSVTLLCGLRNVLEHWITINPTPEGNGNESVEFGCIAGSVVEVEAKVRRGHSFWPTLTVKNPVPVNYEDGSAGGTIGAMHFFHGEIQKLLPAEAPLLGECHLLREEKDRKRGCSIPMPVLRRGR
jgi:hypothetical protein